MEASLVGETSHGHDNLIWRAVTDLSNITKLPTPHIGLDHRESKRIDSGIDIVGLDNGEDGDVHLGRTVPSVFVINITQENSIGDVIIRQSPQTLRGQRNVFPVQINHGVVLFIKLPPETGLSKRIRQLIERVIRRAVIRDVLIHFAEVAEADGCSATAHKLQNWIPYLLVLGQNDSLAVDKDHIIVHLEIEYGETGDMDFSEKLGFFFDLSNKIGMHLVISCRDAQGNEKH
ncbi:hypothetical protein N7507_000328 [Penicillium longicatenatum]|nr:hypothetical protein N7507_000328 [Penicillium longicatenatum]